MKELTPLAWGALGLIGLLALGLYGWLFSILRKKGSQDQTGDELKKSTRALLNPWEKEDQQLSELSKRVKELKNKEQDSGVSEK
jgi:hypothetical protein